MRELRSLLAFTLLSCAVVSTACLDYGGEDDLFEDDPFVDSQALAVSTESAAALSQAREDWERHNRAYDGLYKPS